MKIYRCLIYFGIGLISYTNFGWTGNLRDIKFNECDNIKFSNRKLDLVDLIKIGVCNNPSLKSEYLSIKVSEKELSEKRGEYLPEIEATLSAGKDFTKFEHVSKSNIDNPYGGSINLSWLIYDFGERGSEIRKFKEYLKASKNSYDLKLQDMVLSISKAYFNLLSAEESLKSEMANEEMYAKSYEELKRKYQLGMISLSDELQAKTSYENSSLAVIQAKNIVEQYKGNLAILLNLSPSTKFDLYSTSMDSDIIQIQSDDVNYLMELAIKNRPELKQKENAIEISKHNVKSAKSELTPSIKAVASTSYNDNWKTSNPYKKELYVGLNVSIPLFSGFSSVNAISRTKYGLQQAKYSYESTKNDIKNEVWSAYQNYKTAVDKYAKSEQLLESSEESYKVAFKSYEVGKIDIVSLLTASSQLANSRQERINAFYSVLINKVSLYRTIGEF